MPNHSLVAAVCLLKVLPNLYCINTVVALKRNLAPDS